MNSQRGFSVVEVLIALALFIALGFATLGVTRSFLRAAATSATSEGGTLTLEAQTDELRSDAATAFAVFVPTLDVMGRPNGSGGSGSGGTGSGGSGSGGSGSGSGGSGSGGSGSSGGSGGSGSGGGLGIASDAAHEVDFYTKTDVGAVTYWAYYYDAAAQTLQRFDYDASGRRGEADRATGAIDTSARYPVLPGVVAFEARTLEANELVGSNNVYASAVAPLFAGATPKPLPVGFDDGGPPRTDLYGGNTTVQLRIDTAHGSRTLHLSTAALPSGFTVHAYPQIRAIVYRVDQTHRFWFGLAGKSHVFVNARLDISYDNWRTQPPKNWCDFNLYGYPKGLTGGPAENYHPEWFTESTAGIVYDVTHGHTLGATCPMSPPPPDGVSTAFTPPPNIADTPPPCFYAGQCWPPNAPPDWSPSPAPSSTPPPDWCATHAASTLCGGTGPPPIPVASPGAVATPVAVATSVSIPQYAGGQKPDVSAQTRE